MMTPFPIITVLVVQSSASFLQAITASLGSQEDIEIHSYTVNDKDDASPLGEVQPDFIVCDYSFSDLPDVNTIGRLRKYLPGTPIIAMMRQDTPLARIAARQAGADAVLLKKDVPVHLLPLLRAMVKGETG